MVYAWIFEPGVVVNGGFFSDSWTTGPSHVIEGLNLFPRGKGKFIEAGEV